MNHSPTAQETVNANSGWMLFVVSAASLFVELMLIRWVSTEVRIFAYLQSSVLVVCLMGLGMGFFQSRAGVDWRRALVPLTLVVVFLSIPAIRNEFANISTALSSVGNFLIWGTRYPDPASVSAFAKISALLLATLMLLLIWFAFIPMGQAIGRLMDAHHNSIGAYSINVGGAMAGIAMFTVLSALGTSPVLWFAVLALLMGYIAAMYSTGRKTSIALAAFIPMVVFFGTNLQNAESGVMETAWSPYQKLQYSEQPETDPTNGYEYLRRRIMVNNTGYQEAFDLSPESVARAPGIFDPRASGFSQYDVPLLVKTNPEKVLIVGAGSGNDAAGAIRNGAGEITAVEIDPVIIRFGRDNHPEHPYQSEKVKVVTDDARSFFATTDERFDLIIFGLLDSHTTGSMTNARLDHYVYTRESIERAKSLLKTGGVMTLTFEPDKPYLIDRIHKTLENVFGEKPMLIRFPFEEGFGWGGVMFINGDRQVIDGSIATVPGLQDRIKYLQDNYAVDISGTTEPTSDDWPYLYLENRHIPPLYWLLAGIMAFIFLVSSRWVGMKRPLAGWGKSEAHFFFMGASFMLLEVSMISKSAVALGSVWTVNAVIIAGILSMILVANWIKAKWQSIPMLPVYILLLASTAALYFVDLADIAHLPYAGRALAIAVITTIPMLFSGIVFINSFASSENRSRAMGANLFGALVGAMLLSITFVSGLKFLMVLVGVGYLLAVITAPAGKAPVAS